MEEKLSKYLVSAGVASRRKVDQMIFDGIVKVNNTIVIEPWYNVDCYHDIVTVDNKKVSCSKQTFYVALHKPKGYLSDLSAATGKRLARDLIDVEGRLHPVGRLDYNSEGLIFFTNDGAFSQRVTHPRYEVEKEYLVKVRGLLEEADLRRMERGVSVDGEVLRVKSIRPFRKTDANGWYRVVMVQGRNREIRRIADAAHHPVLKLKRVRIGSVRLDKLKPMEYRFLTPAEVATFMRGKGTR